jgi:hypothetical protein
MLLIIEFWGYILMLQSVLWSIYYCLKLVAHYKNMSVHYRSTLWKCVGAILGSLGFSNGFGVVSYLPSLWLCNTDVIHFEWSYCYMNFEFEIKNNFEFGWGCFTSLVMHQLIGRGLLVPSMLVPNSVQQTLTRAQLDKWSRALHQSLLDKWSRALHQSLLIDKWSRACIAMLRSSKYFVHLKTQSY